MPPSEIDANSPTRLRQPSFRMSTQQLGMLVFLASLSVLFLASIVAYVITRYNHAHWSAVEFEMPSSMLLGALPLGATSVGLELALRAIRGNNQDRLRTELTRAGLYAFGFLAVQTVNWVLVMQASAADPAIVLSLFVFYMLTGLHALHVLAGFVPMAVVLHRAYQREYSSSRHEGVRLCAQYWHFLGVVWVALMATMYLT